MKKPLILIIIMSACKKDPPLPVKCSTFHMETCYYIDATVSHEDCATGTMKTDTIYKMGIKVMSDTFLCPFMPTGEALVLDTTNPVVGHVSFIDQRVVFDKIK